MKEGAGADQVRERATLKVLEEDLKLQIIALRAELKGVQKALR